VDAVQCAVEIHDVIRAKNEELPEDRRMLFRIGVNLGDVIEEGDRIYGDGVNIAARLEGLAEPGGICISGSAHEQIKNKLALGYEYIGEHTVKNITEPLKVYRVPVGPKAETLKDGDEKKTKSKNWRWTAIAAAGAIVVIIGALAIWNSYLRGPSIELASNKTEKETAIPDVKEVPKTIAVLPFENLSSDKKQEYFSDGLADALITKLSQVKDLQITARTSSFYFKGKKVDMRTIGESLGVAYLLEGSVQKSENQLRIIAQLIKAEDGYHLWSETYDRELKDIFAIQDDIIKAVTTALSVTLGVGEFNRSGMTRNIEAYDMYLRADANASSLNQHFVLTAIDQFKQALDIDPDFGLGWLGLSNAYLYAIYFLPPSAVGDFEEKATEAIKRARSVAPDMPELQLETAYEYYENNNWLEADRIYKQILDEQGHANSNANGAYGQLLIGAGRTNDALPYFQRAKMLNPLDPNI
jgi:adenylate cyclase